MVVTQWHWSEHIGLDESLREMSRDRFLGFYNLMMLRSASKNEISLVRVTQTTRLRKSSKWVIYEESLDWWSASTCLGPSICVSILNDTGFPFLGCGFLATDYSEYPTSCLPLAILQGGQCLNPPWRHPQAPWISHRSRSSQICL